MQMVVTCNDQITDQQQGGAAESYRRGQGSKLWRAWGGTTGEWGSGWRATGGGQQPTGTRILWPYTSYKKDGMCVHHPLQSVSGSQWLEKRCLTSSWSSWQPWRRHEKELLLFWSQRAWVKRQIAMGSCKSDHSIETSNFIQCLLKQIKPCYPVNFA